MGTGIAIGVMRAEARFEELYALHCGEALRVAYLMVGDSFHAEDIVQESAVRVLGRFGDLRRPDAFRMYLIRTVLNITKNHWRRRALERRHAQLVDWMPSVYVLPERDDRLIRALGVLPERQRAALVLRYCRDLTEQETAEMMQTSVKAVKSLVTRGRARLRDVLEEPQ